MPNGEVLVSTELQRPIDIFRHLIETGVDTCTNVSDLMGVTKGFVSQLAAIAIKEGWLELAGRRYAIKAKVIRFSQSNDP